MFISRATYFFLLALYTGALLIFLNGMLSVDKTFEENRGIAKTQQTHPSYVKRMVLMVVDGLRKDMLIGPKSKRLWPRLHSYASKRASFCSLSRLQAPTVTMPRIKAITSGSVPKFIDVMHNLFAKATHQDNWLTRSVASGWSFEFYGDNTWLKLFPGHFKQFDGTTSFIVHDFNEVDKNVTRHLKGLSERFSAWNGLILHYLGLDHIGHVEGPTSWKVPAKLMEMDKAADEVLSQLISIESQTNESWIFILTGDHGTSDQGGHGGSSLGETSTGLFIVGSNNASGEGDICARDSGSSIATEQVDLATFTGLLTGTGIPSGSVGLVPAPWLFKFFPNETHAQLSVLLRVIQHFGVLTGCDIVQTGGVQNMAILSSDCWSKAITPEQIISYNQVMRKIGLTFSFLNATDHHKDDPVDFQVPNLFREAHKLLSELQVTLLGSKRYTEVGYMLVGLALMWLVLLVLCNLMANILFRNHSIAGHFTLPVDSLPIDCRTTQFSLSHSSLRMLVRFLTFCLVVQGVSLHSNSFSEEEHQFWYYFSASLLAMIGALTALQYPHRSSAGLHSNPLLLAWIAVLWLDRLVLRRMHQTGDKWIHLPDISDWLYSSEHAIWLWPTQLFTWLLFILLRAFAVANSHWPGQSPQSHRLFRWSPVLSSVLVAGSQMYYRWTTGDQHSEWTVFAARIAYFTLFMDVVIAVTWRRRVRKSSSHLELQPPKEKPSASVAFWTDDFLHPIVSFALLIGLLGRPAVFILWIGVVFKEYMLSRLIEQVFGNWESFYSTKSGRHTIELRLVCCWLVYWTQGWTTFFQQGNSLSLATIDVSAAYVGFRDYHPMIAGLLLATYTFAGPLYWQLAYWARFSSPGASKSPTDLGLRVASIRLFFAILPLTFAATVCLILREHLFIWSVFTPKLVYLTVFQAIFTPFLCLGGLV